MSPPAQALNEPPPPQSKPTDIARVPKGGPDELKKVLESARNDAGPTCRDEVRRALTALIDGIGAHTDYLPLVTLEMSGVNHLDGPKATLKQVAHGVTKCFAPEQIGVVGCRKLVAEISQHATTEIRAYSDGLRHLDPNAALTDVKTMSHARAIERLCELGGCGSGGDRRLARVER